MQGQPQGFTAKLLVAIGWLFSALPILMMGVGGIYFTLFKPAQITKSMQDLGYPSSLGLTLPIIEIICAAIYAIPQTAVLGAILLTGYLGGATASHVRAGQPNWWFPVVFGVFVWVGLYLRDARLRKLLPLRR